MSRGPEDEGGPALDWLLGGAALRRHHGWPTSQRRVTVTEDVFATGVRGLALQHLRTRRYRAEDSPSERLRLLCGALGCDLPQDVRVTRGGTLLMMVSHRDAPAVMRVAPSARAAGLRAAAQALKTLAGGLAVPQLLADVDDMDGMTATLETRLVGRPPLRLGPRVLDDVAGELGRASAAAAVHAPSEGTAAHAVRAMRDDFAERCPAPAHLSVVDRLASHAAEVLDGVPASLQHGDLWHRNLLVHRGRLSGIVDWDSWSPTGVGGADLLGLVTTWDRHRAGATLGQVVATRAWRERRPDLTRLGVPAGLMDAIGIAWWLTSLVGTLTRVPQRAADPRWLATAIAEAGPAGRWLPGGPSLA